MGTEGVEKSFRMGRKERGGPKEDGKETKCTIYGCSSFFFSDIRFFLAASIS